MVTRSVIYSPLAEAQLAELYDWISEARSPKSGERFVSAVLDFCDQLADFPLLGAARDDIRPGLRTLGFRRRVVIAFVVTDELVEVIGVYYGGRDYEPLLFDDI